MITDTEIKAKRVQILATYLGNVAMERFIALIQRPAIRLHEMVSKYR